MKLEVAAKKGKHDARVDKLQIRSNNPAIWPFPYKTTLCLWSKLYLDLLNYKHSRDVFRSAYVPQFDAE